MSLKLTDHMVEYIGKLFDDGLSTKEIAERVCLGRTSVCMARRIAKTPIFKFTRTLEKSVGRRT